MAECSALQNAIVIDWSDDGHFSLSEKRRKKSDHSEKCTNVPEMQVDLVMWTHNSEKTCRMFFREYWRLFHHIVSKEKS